MFQPPWLTRRTRWAVPTGAVAAVAIVAAGTAITSTASTTPSLPHRTAQQLLAQIAAPRNVPQTLIGTIETSAALGLPSLPGAGGAEGPGHSSLLSPSWLLSGTHTYQVWCGGQGRLRIAAPVQLGETDLRSDGRSLWLWDSRANTATHYLPPAGPGGPALPIPPGHSKTSVAYSSSVSVSPDSSELTAGAMGLTSPYQAAQRFLAAVGPTTTVRMADNVTVAGRAAYQLELAPKSTQSLIGQVDIAVDAATSLPLRVQVFARGAASPAYSVGFTALSFARPDPSNFTFTPPPGAKVRTVRLPAGPGPFAGPPGMVSPVQVGPPHQRLRLHGRRGVVFCKPQGPQIHLVPKGCVPRLPHGWQMTGPLTPGQQKKLARRLGLTPAQFAVLIHGGRGAPAFGLVRPDQLRGCRSGWSAYSLATGLTDPGPCTRRTFGSSWTTVVTFPPGVGLRSVSPFGLLLRAATPVHGSWGSGRLLTTSLLSVLVTSDGTVLAGAVTPDTLFADAAQLTAQHARAG
jgi:outer membrane lipoprotein-sorting protein